ncbi:MAG: M20 family metallopeptidase [Thermomicrobiales bacterium]
MAVAERIDVDVVAARKAAAEAVAAARDGLIELSRFIHANPEIALEEVKCSAACADFLEQHGFAVERGVAGLPTAFASRVGTAEPTIAYLSEYDALPGLGHGCGHNLIAIAGIGAGIGLAAALPHLGGRGQVRVFGTPAEEAVGGKVIMANAGVFEGVAAAMGAHPGTSEAVCPTVEGSGQALACVLVRTTFHGQAAHAAADPFNGVNALNAVIETFNGINALRQHITSDARIHGIITHGGDVPNVVPHYAQAEFFVRAATLAGMTRLVEQVIRIAEGAAMITGATVEIEMPEEPNSDMVTNYTLAQRLSANLDHVGLTMPQAKPEPGSGSTDWGNVSYVVPSVETGFPIIDRVCTWHSQDVVDASVSDLGLGNTISVATAMALTGVDLIAEPELVADIQDEFAKALAARV